MQGKRIEQIRDSQRIIAVCLLIGLAIVVYWATIKIADALIHDHAPIFARMKSHELRGFHGNDTTPTIKKEIVLIEFYDREESALGLRRTEKTTKVFEVSE